MSATPVSKSPNAPLGDDEIDALADLVDLIDERTDVPVSLEGLDGFLLALACSPPPAGYARWPLRLLEKHVIATEGIPPMDHSTIGRVLKRGRLSLT